MCLSPERDECTARIAHACCSPFERSLVVVFPAGDEERVSEASLSAWSDCSLAVVSS